MPRLRTLGLRACILLAGLAIGAAPVAASAQQHFPATEDLDLMLRYLVEDGETPGIVLGVLDADGSTRVLHYGEAGPGARPLGPHSVFEIGSITKTFTAALLADMVARGEMALDDPVQEYLPESVTMPTWQGREITLMDLSTHHSGLPRMPENFDPADPENPYADYTMERLYAFLSSHELRREPGSEYEYSNLAVGLLGHVLERASGMSYEDLVRSRILEPLGMNLTGITLEGELGEWMTKGHDGVGDVVPYWDAMVMAGAGGLRSNVEDMLTYLAAQMGPPDSEIERAMRTTHEVRVEREDGAANGLGWSIQTLGERRILTHGGGTAGYSTMVGFDPELRVGIVMLANAGDFGDDLASDLLRQGAPITTPTVAVPRGTLERFAGLYEDEHGGRLAVRLELEGWLTVQTPRNVRFRMHADSDTSFYLRRTPWRFTFRTDSLGDVTGFVADLAGTEVRARKVDDAVPDPQVVAGNFIHQDLPPLTAEEMALYEGRYAIRSDPQPMEVRVFVEDGQLMGQPTGQRSTRLLHQGDHAFIPMADTNLRLVFQVEDGQAERLTLHAGGRAFSGKRLAPGESMPPEEEVLDRPVTAEDIARYEGVYLLVIGERTLELRIFPQDGRLVSQAAGQRVAPLRYQGEHVFVPDFDDSVRLIFTVEGDRATSVTLHQGGVFRGDRQP